MAERLGLQNIRFLNPQQKNGVEYGMGTIGELPSEISAEQFVELVKKTFNCCCVITNPLIKHPIRRIAVMGGAGDCAIGAAEKAGADAFITGEMHYHQYFDHDDIQLAVIGHYESEQYTQHLLKKVIERDCVGVKCYIADTQTNPLRYH
jgi:putative NIF3 family GTP cyclohydrolase 1 type 2